MKMSNAEVMKKITLLNNEKDELRRREIQTNYIQYPSSEDKKQALEGNDYDYYKTTEMIAEIDKQIIYLKGKLAYANATVMVDGYDLTIGQCLVKLGQLNDAIERYDSLRGQKQKSSMVASTGIVTYTEYLYNIAESKEIYKKLVEEKASLQVAVDRVNLLNEIEI